jgi:hypothetical protein
MHTGRCFEIAKSLSNMSADNMFEDFRCSSCLMTTGLLMLRQLPTSSKRPSRSNLSYGRWATCWDSGVDIGNLAMNCMVGMSTSSQTLWPDLLYTAGSTVTWPSCQVIVGLFAGTSLPNTPTVRSRWDFVAILEMDWDRMITALILRQGRDQWTRQVKSSW